MMMLSQAAQSVRGTLVGADVLFTCVSKDTRVVKEGSLYVALKGENFDGHDFIDEAKNAGAVAAIVSERQNTALPQITVKDTRLALGELAASWRQSYKGHVVGVTGSNGKTTVKEMCYCILSYVYGEEKVICTQGNLNNDIGLPMTLLDINNNHDFAVIEMGANHLGEIGYLTSIANPDVAVITNAGIAHIEGFGSVENIANGKAEIFDGLSQNGVAIINRDDDFADAWIEKNRNNKTITFSMVSPDVDVFATDVDNDSFTLNVNNDSVRINMRIPGKHNILNALAAASVSTALGVDVKNIAAALQCFSGVKGRLQISQIKNGPCIIDDTYNANPYSLNAAIDVLVAQGKDAWLVLGDMGELGDNAEAMHREAGVYARKSGVKHLYATGDVSRFAVDGFGEGGFFYANKTDLIAALLEVVNETVAVLVKGSRFMKMDEVSNALLRSAKSLNDHSKENQVEK